MSGWVGVVVVFRLVFGCLGFMFVFVVGCLFGCG